MTFNTHAPDRRTLVRTLQEHLGIDAVYSGPPTFTYQLGNLTIERDGSITAANVADLKAVGPFLLERGWADDEALSGADVAATVPDLEAAPETEPEAGETAEAPAAAEEETDPAAMQWIEQAIYRTAYTAALLGNTEERDRMVKKYRKHFPDGKYAAEIGSLPASQAQ